MKMWEETREHLEKMLKIFPKSSDAIKLLKQTTIRLNESTTGNYDVMRLYREVNSRKIALLDAADYRKLVEVFF